MYLKTSIRRLKILKDKQRTPLDDDESLHISVSGEQESPPVYNLLQVETQTSTPNVQDAATSDTGIEQSGRYFIFTI